MDAILEFFSALPRELYVFVISILPIVELRGAIPVGAALGMPFYWNYILSVVGNLLPVPFILLFITKLMDFLRRFKTFRPLVDWIRRKADKYSSKVIKDADNSAAIEVASDEGAEAVPTQSKAFSPIRKMTWGVFTALAVFVAVPLPGTGAWTGALIASVFNLPKRHSLVAIALGVFVSGIIMTLVSYGVLGFLSWLI